MPTALPLAPAEPAGDADGDAVATGAGCRPIGSVFDLDVASARPTAVASRSFAANTASTCFRASPFDSSNLTPTVPPV